MARRLVLFDIDGTLLSGGPAREAFHLAMFEVYGTAGPIEEWEFSGKTDPQIARELLTHEGYAQDRIDEGFPRLWTRYLTLMQERIADDPPRELPGVHELLTELQSQSDIALGLVTGNVVGGADLKLSSIGLGDRFAIGAYGSDHEVRNELPGLAVRRASAHWGVEFPSREVVIVGDTPRDVDCGRHHGARTVAVATGRFDLESLDATGADAVLSDLSSTKAVLDVILTI
jgi:phosphoglycolate phosphatase